MSGPCEQHDKIKHIEHDLENHKDWRKAVSAQLTNIEVSLATLNERMKSGFISSDKEISSKMKAFDDHVKDGASFRTALVLTIVGLVASFACGFIGYGKLEQKVDHLYEELKSK